MRSLDLGGENQRGKRWEEEINPKARGRRERELTGDCSRQSSSPAGGSSSPATASGGARALRAGGRLRALSRRVLATG